MAITNGYVTLAEARNRLLTTGATDTSDDTQIEAIVEAASRKVDGDCWRRFWTTPADETRYYKPIDFDCVLPDDIVSVTSIALDLDGDGTFETTLTTSDYDLLPYNATVDGIPYNHIITKPQGNYSFPRGFKSVKIVGKFGWNGSTVVEARTFTAPLATTAYVDNLSIISALTTDGDANGTYETTWTVTDDYVATAVAGTPTTLIVASGIKVFPTAASGVKIVGTWNLTGAPKDIKEATLVQCLIMYQTKNLVGGMGKLNSTIEELDKTYQRLIPPFVRSV